MRPRRAGLVGATLAGAAGAGAPRARRTCGAVPVVARGGNRLAAGGHRGRPGCGTGRDGGAALGRCRAPSRPETGGVFTTRPAPGDEGGHDVIRIDRGLRQRVGPRYVPGPTGLHAGRGRSGGGRVALAAPRWASTTIVDFDPAQGRPANDDVRGPGGARAFRTDRNRCSWPASTRTATTCTRLDRTPEPVPHVGPDRRAAVGHDGSVVQRPSAPTGRSSPRWYRDDTTPDHTVLSTSSPWKSGVDPLRRPRRPLRHRSSRAPMPSPAGRRHRRRRAPGRMIPASP